MSGPIFNQAWEDVASDVTSAIEKAVQPLLKKAVDEVYTGLLDATQDYLSDNLAFNIASRISAAEQEAARDRAFAEQLKVCIGRIGAIATAAPELNLSNYDEDQVSELNEAMIEIHRLCNGGVL